MPREDVRSLVVLIGLSETELMELTFASREAKSFFSASSLFFVVHPSLSCLIFENLDDVLFLFSMSCVDYVASNEVSSVSFNGVELLMLGF